MATINRVPLSHFAEEPEHPCIGRARHRAVIVSCCLCCLLVIGTAIVSTVLLAGNPLVLFANATASMVSTSASQDPAAEPMPTIQSNTKTYVLPPIATDAPPGDTTAGAGQNASETEIRESQAEALLREFRSWAAEEDARAQMQHIEPVQPLEPLRDVRGQDDIENVRAEVRSAQEHRPVRSQHNVRTGSVKNARAQVQSEHKVREVRSKHYAREMHNDRVQGSSGQTGRNTPARDQSAENAWSLWPHQIFGWLH